MEAYSDSLLHHRRHLPGRQPADPDHRQGRRRRRQHPQHHRPGRNRSTGACTPTTRAGPTASTRATAASSARSATTPPATSSTRSTPPPRTGSRASPDIPVKLYAPVECGSTRVAPCDADGNYELAPDGSYAKGKLLNTYVSESWSRPTGCTARDVDGNPLVHGVDENVLAPEPGDRRRCASRPSCRASQFGTYPTDQGTPDANFGAAVNGNYGFGDGCFNGTLDASDPCQPGLRRRRCRVRAARRRATTSSAWHRHPERRRRGKPMYKVTGEEDINIGNGDQIVPQVPPPACAGSAAHGRPRRHHGRER